MDITGTSSLWKEYDVSALPLEASALSAKTENGMTVREFYFNGYTTVDGVVRTYVKITEAPDAKGVVLFLPDADGKTEKSEELLCRGLTVAHLDYAGKRDGPGRYTIYPEILSDCNLAGRTYFEATDDVLKSCWFVWTCMARRAIKLLKDNYPDKKLFAYGIGLGGCTVYKLAAFEDGLTAAATALNILPDVRGTGNRIINYRAGLENNAYAPITKIPLYMAAATNDEDGSFDDVCELADSTESLRCMRIVERAFSGGIDVIYEQIPKYFSACANGTTHFPTPVLKAENSGDKLYFNIKIEREGNADPRPLQKVELFVAFVVENSRHRNWTNAKIISLGDNEFMARTDIMQSEKPVYAFVNITDADGDKLSSPQLSVVPKTLGIPSMPVSAKRRMIYESSIGPDVWTSPTGGRVFMKNGPYDIPGVTSESNAIITFKPGDRLYTGEKDSLLQVIMSGQKQKVTVEVSDETDDYSCDVDIPDSTEWHKQTLAYNDFKSPTGAMPDLSKIIMIKIYAQDEFLISSVLWV